MNQGTIPLITLSLDLVILFSITDTLGKTSNGQPQLVHHYNLVSDALYYRKTLLSKKHNYVLGIKKRFSVKIYFDI